MPAPLSHDTSSHGGPRKAGSVPVGAGPPGYRLRRWYRRDRRRLPRDIASGDGIRPTGGVRPAPREDSCVGRPPDRPKRAWDRGYHRPPRYPGQRRGVAARRHGRGHGPMPPAGWRGSTGILGPHASPRPPLRHRHQADPRDAPGDGRGRGRRRRLRRRPDRQRARGAGGRAARQGGRPVRDERDDGQPRRPDGPPRPRPGGDRRDASATSSWTRRPATPSSSGRACASCESGRTGRSTRPRSTPRSATRATPTSRSPAWSRSRTPTPTRWASRCPWRTPRRSRPSPTPRRAAPRRRGALLQRRRRPRASTARELAEPADSVTFCLSQGAGLPRRLGRRREPRLHLAGAPGAQAPRRRHAPGRASSPRPGWSPCGTGRPG